MAGRGGYKRNRRGDPKQNLTRKEAAHPDVDESSPVIQAFRSFQAELDSRHDRHERIVKIGRDVTIESKRAIFLLHRSIRNKDKSAVLKEAGDKLEEIRQTKWTNIAVELQDQDPYQFLRAYSPGLQEYIEAVSFHQYINDGSLITQDEVENQLVFNKKVHEEKLDHESESTNKPATSQQDTSAAAGAEPLPTDPASTEPTETVSVHVPPTEYVLGLADLSGELMRMAINAVAGGDLELPSKICGFLRVMHDAFVSFGNSHRDLPKKVWTLKQSMRKVENVCYTLQVRGSEVPKHMLVDVISSQSKSETYEPEESSII